MITIYGLKNCDRCKKALKVLHEQDMDVTFVDIRANTPAIETLAHWWGILGETMLNKRSTTWKNLNDEDRAEEPISLMYQYPTLIKRPIIVRGDAIEVILKI